MKAYAPFLILGLVTGCIYAIAAMGLVLTYRTTGLFNFAHGAIGMATAFAFYQLRQEWGWPTPIAVVVCLVGVAPGLGVVIDKVLFRSLADASQAAKVVVTVGLLILLQQSADIIYGSGTRSVPSFLPTSTFRVADVNIGYDQVAIVAIAFGVLAALTLFLSRSRLGVAMRGLVDNRELTDAAGFPVARISAITWALGAVLAGLAGILFVPLVALSPILLTLLVVKAFGAAIIGRLSSLTGTMVGALVIGVTEAMSLKVFESQTNLVNGLRPSVAFIALFGVLLFSRRGSLRELGLSAPWQGVVRGARLRPSRVLALCAVLMAASAVLPDARVFVLGNALVMSCLFVSLGLLIGTSGLVNLAQAALAGTGAFMYIHMTADWGLPFGLALILAGLVVVPLGLAIAVPALRLPGLFLTLATFGFGQLVDGLIFNGWRSFSGGDNGLRGPRPSLLQTDHRYVLFLIVMLALFLFVAGYVRQSALGRTLTAIRDSPAASRTLGVNPLWPKLALFATSAFLAGVAGGLYAGLLQVASPRFFFTFNSLVWLTVVVVAGVQSDFGAVLAGFLLVWPPELLQAHPGIVKYITPAFGLGAILMARRPGGILGAFDGKVPRRLVAINRSRPPLVQQRLAGAQDG